MNIQQVGLLLCVFACSSLVFSDFISSVLPADEGVISADPEQSPTEVQNHQRSSPAVSGGHEEAPSPKPWTEEPEELHEEDEERQEGGQSPISLSLTAATSHQSTQEQRVSESAPPAGSANCPSAACCKRRTLEPDGTDQPPEDAGDPGDQEDEKGGKREENSNVGLSLLAVGSLREQVEAEPSQEAEPSGEMCRRETKGMNFRVY